MKYFLLIVDVILTAGSFAATLHNADTMLTLLAKALSITLTVVMLFKHKTHLQDAVDFFKSISKPNKDNEV